MAKQPLSSFAHAWLKSIASFLRPVARLSTFLLGWAHRIGLVLKPCRFNLLQIATGLTFLFISEQGLYTLRDFAERLAANPDASSQILFFLLGCFLWTFGSWYWARLLYYVHLDDALPDANWVRWTQTWLPRLIGLSAILGLAWAFYCAAAPYPNTFAGPGPVLMMYAYICLGGAIAFFAFSLTRRTLSRRLVKPLSHYRLTTGFSRLLDRVQTSKQQRYGSNNVFEALRAGWPILGLTIIVAVGLLIFFTLSPELFAPMVGSAPILLLAAAGWTAFGSAVDLFGMRSHFPVFTTLLILALFFSFWSDDHAVRVLDSAHTQPFENRPQLVNALREWLQRQLMRPLPRGANHYPLFIVAAEGGGVRAAYWTATVLGTVQDRYPCFADQLFAISGVSGGSLGSAVFVALLADENYQVPNFRCGGRHTPTLTQKAQRILDEDFLAPAIVATLYQDLIQRLSPSMIPHSDLARASAVARALGASWERAWRRHTGNSRFSQPFDNLWLDHRDYWLPALFLNSTWAETGKRLIVSNLRLTENDFNAIEDAQQFFGKSSLPLSVAVNPIGTLAKDGVVYGHVADGGYFDNSGTTTVLEILKTIDQLQGGSDRFWSRVEPVVIYISNKPVDPSYPETRLGVNRIGRDTRTEPTRILAKLPTPTINMTDVRDTDDAHSVYASKTLRWHVGPSQFLHFGLCRMGDQLSAPIDWGSARVVGAEMSRQLNVESCEAFDNPRNIAVIGKHLAKRTAQFQQ